MYFCMLTTVYCFQPFFVQVPKMDFLSRFGWCKYLEKYSPQIWNISAHKAAYLVSKYRVACQQRSVGTQVLIWKICLWNVEFRFLNVQ